MIFEFLKLIIAYLSSSVKYSKKMLLAKGNEVILQLFLFSCMIFELSTLYGKGIIYPSPKTLINTANIVILIDFNCILKCNG